MLPFAITIFLSAFLLFLVQPLIAKQILPWFGGAANVWAICLVFFQAMLLLGYAYADGLIRWTRPRQQVIVHTALVVVSLIVLPVVADPAWKPEGEEEPTWRILGLLGATIGLPYLVLSATTPLMQSWFWRRFRSTAPYRLFALSNLASLVALLSYPTWVEPSLTVGETAGAWSGLYALFASLGLGTAWWSLREASARQGGEGADRTEVVEREAAGRARVANDLEELELPDISEIELPLPGFPYRLTAAVQIEWVALAASGSAMLLAVTNHITQNVASVPFLWVLPLALYLLSFILVFDHPRWYRRTLWLLLVGALGIAMAAQLDSLDLRVAAPLYGSGLFVTCMFCHGELAMLKPPARHLTRFYLMVALGGAMGALLVGVVVPLALPGYYELGLLLLLLCGLVIRRLVDEPILATFMAIGVSGVVALLVGVNLRDYGEDVRVMERDFYGVVRTRDRSDPVEFRALYHGGIMHGGQLLDPADRRSPSTYFGPTSGYGRVFASLPATPVRVGVIGLGAGALAAYGRKGDTFVFYEIAPTVIDVARREFTFLVDSAAAIEIVAGDGRLALERASPQNFDVLAVDAFAGDAIPMHLLTREAMAIYLRHVKPEGAIVFQATNRFIDIVPVIKRLAAEPGLAAVLVADSPDRPVGADYWLADTEQVIVTRNHALLEAPAIAEAAAAIEDRPGLRTFTDDYSSLIQILR